MCLTSNDIHGIYCVKEILNKFKVYRKTTYKCTLNNFNNFYKLLYYNLGKICQNLLIKMQFLYYTPPDGKRSGQQLVAY